MEVQRPKINSPISGLIWFREHYYSFFIPTHWNKLCWADGRDGVIFCPDPIDPHSVFTVDMQDLATIIFPDDLEILAEGFCEGLETLPELNLESYNQKVTGRLLELEAKYTFCECGEIRKRWTRVFYHHTHQVVINAQGANTDKFHYWLPWFFEAMSTLRIHDKTPQLIPAGRW